MFRSEGKLGFLLPGSHFLDVVQLRPFSARFQSLHVFKSKVLAIQKEMARLKEIARLRISGQNLLFPVQYQSKAKVSCTLVADLNYFSKIRDL